VEKVCTIVFNHFANHFNVDNMEQPGWRIYTSNHLSVLDKGKIEKTF